MHQSLITAACLIWVTLFLGEPLLSGHPLSGHPLLNNHPLLLAIYREVIIRKHYKQTLLNGHPNCNTCLPWVCFGKGINKEEP